MYFSGDPFSCLRGSGSAEDEPVLTSRVGCVLYSDRTQNPAGARRLPSSLRPGSGLTSFLYEGQFKFITSVYIFYLFILLVQTQDFDSLLISAIFETFSFLIFLALLSVLDDALCTPAAGLSPPFPHPCANLGISLNDQDKSAFHLLLEMWDISSTYLFFVVLLNPKIYKFKIYFMKIKMI